MLGFSQQRQQVCIEVIPSVIGLGEGRGGCVQALGQCLNQAGMVWVGKEPLERRGLGELCGAAISPSRFTSSSSHSLL